MRSKTPLVLMEQLVMVLVFAMAAAVCLQVFALSDRISRREDALSQAVLLAQNTAEELKASHGDALMDWKTAEGYLYLEQELEGIENCRIEVWQEETAAEGLQQVELKITDGEEVLFTLPVAWQEVGSDG